MRVLVIGGTRFIGPWVVRGLSALGHPVTVFHRGETESQLPPHVEYLHGDRKHLADFASQFERSAPDVVLDVISLTQDRGGVDRTNWSGGGMVK